MKTVDEQIIEAMQLRLYRKTHENEFVKRIARVYCVRPKNGSEGALYDMLTTVYEYGRITGVRSERKRKHGR